MFAFLATVAVAQQGGIVALTGLDPVELCQGREVAGEAEIGFTHLLYKYRFTSEANLRTFQGDPERYAIQWGGACARMGPLSGRGSPSRFTVHDGRIYLFASDQCRDGFLKDPARFLPRDEAGLGASVDAEKAGAALLARAIDGLGGKAALGSWRILQIERSSTAKTAQGERLDTDTLVCTRDGSIRVDQTYGDHHYSTLLLPQGGSFVGNDGVAEPMHATGVRELQLQILRQPLVLLARTGDKGVQAAAAGTAVVGDAAVDLLQVYCDGARTTLGIDRDGRIVLQRYRGRGPQLWFGEVEWTFSDFRKVGEVMLPYHQELTFDGKPQAQSTQQQDRIAIDPELPADYFAPKRH